MKNAQKNCMDLFIDKKKHALVAVFINQFIASGTVVLVHLPKGFKIIVPIPDLVSNYISAFAVTGMGVDPTPYSLHNAKRVNPPPLRKARWFIKAFCSASCSEIVFHHFFGCI